VERHADGGTPVPAAGRPADSRSPSAGAGARRAGGGALGAAPGAGAHATCAESHPELAGGAPGPRVGDRRLASLGHARSVIARVTRGLRVPRREPSLIPGGRL
jgi:hypothetical protein